MMDEPKAAPSYWDKTSDGGRYKLVTRGERSNEPTGKLSYNSEFRHTKNSLIFYRFNKLFIRKVATAG